MLEVLPEKSFRERIASLIKLVGSAEKLASSSGMSSRVIGKYLAGESDPSREKLVALAKAAGVSVEWLATGEGPMRREQFDHHGMRHDDGVDEKLLTSVIEAVEEHLAAMEGSLEPCKKAQLITTLYALFQKENSKAVDRSTVLRLVKLAV